MPTYRRTTDKSMCVCVYVLCVCVCQVFSFVHIVPSSATRNSSLMNSSGVSLLCHLSGLRPLQLMMHTHIHADMFLTGTPQDSFGRSLSR